MRSLVRRYGWNPTSPQILDGHYRYWFGEEAVVAYVDTGTSLVVAGAPVCSLTSLAAVTHRFAAAAARRKRSVAFFGVQRRFLARTKLPSVAIGELLFWRPNHWPVVLNATPSLREQLRRARAKGVRIEKAEPGSGPLAERLQSLRSSWLGGKGMAPLAFLAKPVNLRSAGGPDNTLLLAWQGSQLVGYLCLRPIPARKAGLVQEWVRGPTAPNGTIELLLDAAFRVAAKAGLRYATLGLSPLAGAVPFWLRSAAVLGRSLYDFEGLSRFKAKLRPDGREMVALAGLGASSAQLVFESLRAFAGGGLLAFGAATVRQRIDRTVRFGLPTPITSVRHTSRAGPPAS